MDIISHLEKHPKHKELVEEFLNEKEEDVKKRGTSKGPIFDYLGK